MTTPQIISTARAEGWTRRRVKEACFTHKIAGEERDSVYSALGFATPTANIAAVQAEQAAQAAREAQQVAAQVAQAAQARAAREAHEAAEAAAEQARKTRIAGEIAAGRDIEPNWSVYRQVISLMPEALEAIDAAKHRDAGDWLANKPSLEMLDLLIGNAGEFAGDVWSTVRRTGRASEKQIKVLAIAAAKHN